MNKSGLIPAGIVFVSLATQAGPSLMDTALDVREYRVNHEQQIIDDFAALLRLPNVATDLEAIRRNAEHIQRLLDPRGFETRLLELGPDVPPAIYGERRSADAELTVVLYVHYDGQPVQAENWSSPPWQPVLRDGMVESGGKIVPMTAPFDPQWRLFGRSAGDDKAPVIALIHAIDALDHLGITPSINLKLFFEGEEEISSPHLRDMLERHKALLDADIWLFCDGPMHPSGRPQLAYGVRGVTGFDLSVYGALRPLHSGHYGNWAPNPVSMLSHLLAGMRDNDGRVLIEGFYDDVDEPTMAELAAIDTIPKVDLSLRHELGLARTEGQDRVERAILRPALNFKAIHAGDTGEGARNVILPEATASIGIRLVPGQTVAGVRTVVERHLRQQGYHLVVTDPDHETRLGHPRIARVNWSFGYPAYRTPLDNPVARALAGLLNEFSNGDLIQVPTMGGSLPLYIIPEVVGAPVIILPIANHDNNQHGKDENLRLQNLWDAIEIYAVTLAELGHRVATR